MIQIAVINKSSILRDADVAAYAKAQQLAIYRDLFPAYGVLAYLVVLPSGAARPPKPWWIAEYVDKLPPEDGALAEHDVIETDRPHLICGVQTTIDDGGEPSAAMDHEIKETLVDPMANRLAQVGNRVSWYECCDPVQGGYKDDHTGVWLENFILENYWIPGSAGPWDHRGELDGPLTLSKTGYRMDAHFDGAWSQAGLPFALVCGSCTRAAKRKPHWLSRPARRLRRMARQAAGMR